MADDIGGAKAGVAVVDEEALRGRIHEIRGQRVMLDFDLAEIYGYTTKAFNQQVQRNIEKFDEDFMFRLTEEEIASVRSQIVTSRIDGFFAGQSGGTRYLPHAFTEQGFYMLMTVLRGELATRQSKALIRLFKRMKDCLAGLPESGGNGAVLALAAQTGELREGLAETREGLAETRAALAETQEDLAVTGAALAETREGLVETRGEMRAGFEETRAGFEEVRGEMRVGIAEANEGLAETRGELAETREALEGFMAGFGASPFSAEVLILDGQPVEADLAYQRIYGLAKRSVLVVDPYVGLKTLEHLRHLPAGVGATVSTDNRGRGLTAAELGDFRREHPGVKLTLRSAGGRVHDRLVVIDRGEPTERVFVCGASSKDAGRRATVIFESTMPWAYRTLADDLLSRPELAL